MAHSIKAYWILFSIGSCAYCFHSTSNQNAKQVIEGNSMNLTCHISSDIILCAWFHSNEDSLSLSSSDKPQYITFGNHSIGECHLYIKKAKLESDNGIWTCQMTTVKKVNISNHINLTVLPRDFVHIKGDSALTRPGVFVGAFCAAMFTIGGLITIYLYNKKGPCCLAPTGYLSRSMLVWDTSPSDSRNQGLEYDNAT